MAENPTIEAPLECAVNMALNTYANAYAEVKAENERLLEVLEAIAKPITPPGKSENDYADIHEVVDILVSRVALARIALNQQNPNEYTEGKEGSHG